MTIRTLSAGLLTLLLVLPCLTGVHHHLSLATTHDQLEDMPSADIAPAQHADSLDGNHQASHEHHGQVDVDPPEKAFSKNFQGKLPVGALLAALPLILLLVRTQPVAARPPMRPPRHRSRSHLFPPSQAPPAAC